MTVNDTHCHFLSSRFFEALGHEKRGPQAAFTGDQIAAELGWDAPGTPDSLAERWIAEIDRHHVSRAALIASVPGDEVSVADAVKRYPDRFVGFFALNAAAPDAQRPGFFRRKFQKTFEARSRARHPHILAPPLLYSAATVSPHKERDDENQDPNRSAEDPFVSQGGHRLRHRHALSDGDHRHQITIARSKLA